METRKTEQGQALVLIVLAIVVIFGFAALAVDMGRTYSERRRAQNAADSAAMAAAFAVRDAEMARPPVTLTAAEMEQKALKKAAENGFASTTGNNRVVVEYHHPPVSGPYKDNEEYHQVFVTTTVDQSFSQLVFNGTQRLTVEAVARSRPTESITPGNAMHASNASACRAMEFDGAVQTDVTGGNIYSNSGGTGNCASGWKNGSGSVDVHGADIQAAGTWNTVGSGTVSPGPQEMVPHQSLPDVPIPDCSNLDPLPAGSNNLLPGIYSGITVHDDVTMAPGMYCLDGDFTVNGSGSLTGDGVFIVMRRGSVSFNGNGDINLTRANDVTDGAEQHWGGMLFYMLPANDGGIDLGGTGNSRYTGTIYAPGPRRSNTAKCVIGGTSGSIGVSANIICDTIKVNGNATVSINYVEEQNYRMAPMVELTQ